MSQSYLLPCKFCSNNHDISETVCPNTGEVIGEPINVKRASLPIEKKALQDKYLRAKLKLNGDDLTAEANFFEEPIQNRGRPIINMPFNFLWFWLTNNESYKSYRRQILENVRPKALFQNDVNRTIVDSFLYGSEIDIIYSALTINKTGLTTYGQVSVILKEISVAKRTSCLYSNSFRFFNKLINEQKYSFGEPFPVGYLGTWYDNFKLATAKHNNEIVKGIDEDKCAMILLKSGESRDKDDFIELHIHGNIFSSAIDEIIIPENYIKHLMR
jgi:hypothetical protein